MEQVALYAVVAGGLVVLVLAWVPLPPGRRGASIVLSLFGCTLLINQSWLGNYSTIVLGAGASLGAAGIYILTAAEKPRIAWAQWLILLIPLHLFFVDALLNSDRSEFDIFARVLPFVVLLAVASLLTAPDRMLVVRTALQTSFGFACVLSAFAPEVWAHCSIFKCSVAQQLFVGAFDSENVLGGIAGLVAVTSVGEPRKRLRFATLLLCALVLVVTNSRTSQIAAVLALAAMAVSAVFQQRPGVARFGWPFVLPFTIVPTVLGIRLVFTAAPTDFSNRGRIWHLGLQYFDGAWVVGKGMSAWPKVQLYDAFMHSQNLLLLFSGGLVAVALWVVVCALALRNGRALGAPMAIGFMVLVLTRGLVELVWNPLGLDFTGLFVIPLLALVVPVSSEPATEPGPLAATGKDGVHALAEATPSR